MPDLLLELFSEEIPARMQAKAADDLRRLVTDRLVNAGLVYEGAKAFATPRRLALTVHGVPVRQPDVREERKGPRVGAPENAVAGFLKAAGLASIEQAKVQPDKKGDFYLAVIEKPGRAAIDLIADIVPEVIRSFPWPKAMRWGDGALTWVRPLHSIVATFGPETEEPEIVPFALDGIAAGNVTRGHRFMAPGPIVVRRFDDYLHKLEAAKVVLDPYRREQTILADAKDLAFAQGYELVEDAGLLSEVAGLVEWPVVLMGSFDESFLSIPPEVIRTTIRNNQKCFVLTRGAASPFETRPAAAPQGEAERSSALAARNKAISSVPHPEEARSAVSKPHPEEARSAVSKDGHKLAPRFILVANIEAADGGKAIVAGNERVIRARLSDAKFFYETDLKHWREAPLDARLKKFESIVFHEKLGTQAERIARIERLAAELAPLVGADVEKTKRAARLCKADLLTEMVGEFPELQGVMGKYYALATGEDASVAAACEDHYKPVGPNDRVPTDPVSIAVALADKLDTLGGFWAIDEKPTGSKDPYALRRAALGVIRIVLERRLRIPLRCIVEASNKTHATTLILSGMACERVDPADINAELSAPATRLIYDVDHGTSMDDAIEKVHLSGCDLYKCFDKEGHYPTDNDYLGRREGIYAWIDNLLAFFADRLEVQLREQGARHDLVRAVFALEGQDDLLMIVRRVEVLGKFLDTDDGRNLLAGYKRATNIIRIEEKKDKRAYTGAPDPSLYQQDEERALAAAIDAAKTQAAEAVAREDFAGAMAAIAPLRPRVDAFFDKVTVNVDDKALRENRLRLLNEIREATRAVADFSRIEG